MRQYFHHESSIEDDLLHYFGCLRFDERPKVFKRPKGKETDKLRQRIVEEKTRTSRLRATFWVEGSKTPNGRLVTRYKITRSLLFPSVGRSQSEASPQASLPSAQPSQKHPGDYNINLDDLNANVIYLNDAWPYDHSDFLDEKLLNPKIPLAPLLKNDKSNKPLMWKCEDNMIRYFHLPANNTDWVKV